MDISLSKATAFFRPKRRWFQYSLRTLFIVMTLFAVWFGPHVHSTRLQMQSVDAVHDYDGQVRYDYQYPKGRYGRNDFSYSATSPVPQWLLDLVGVDFFHDVVEVDVRRKYGYSRQNPSADDGLLHQLRGFPELRRLELSHCGITDKGLRHLPVLTSLEALDLSYAAVTDDGMPYVGRLKSLKWLDLSHTRVGGRGFHRLARLEQLEVLNLTYAPIRDEALSRIKGIQGLRDVSVHGCRYLTPTGVAVFRQAAPKCTLGGLHRLKSHWQGGREASHFGTDGKPDGGKTRDRS